jgi:hypothetical protein
MLQEKRLQAEVAALEKDTGFKLRVLAQSYPETPGAVCVTLGPAGLMWQWQASATC